MAIISGVSPMWGNIYKTLKSSGIQVNHPKEIEPLLDRYLIDYSQKYRQVHRDLEAEIWQIEQEIKEQRETGKSLLSSLENYSELEIKQSEANLDLLKHDRSLFNSIRNYFRTRRETRKLTSLQSTLQEKKEEIEGPIQEKEKEIQAKKLQIDDSTRKECAGILEKIEVLKTFAGTQEIATAIAELDMLELLKNLPDNVYVNNNIYLRIDKGILFEGIWLINGQIDHLVITQAGLFAVKIKNWGKKTEDYSKSFDPYEQIRLASQLCYEVLRQDFPGISVRSILAYRGHPPELEASNAVKVLQLHEVSAYLAWFKDKTLDDEAMRRINLRIQEMQV